MHSLALSCLVIAVSSAGLWGCGSGRNDVEKRLSAMRQEISELQAQNDRLEERLEAVEVKQIKVASAAPAKPSGDATLERPPLKIIRLEPGDAAPASAEPASGPSDVKPDERPDDPTPRPVIRLRGGKRGDEVSKSERANEARRLSQNDASASSRDGE